MVTGKGKKIATPAIQYEPATSLDIDEAALQLHISAKAVWHYLETGKLDAVMRAAITNKADASDVRYDYALISPEGVRLVLMHDGELDQSIEWNCWGGQWTAVARADKEQIRVLADGILRLLQVRTKKKSSRDNVRQRNIEWLAELEIEVSRQKHGAITRTAKKYQVELSTFRKACNSAREIRRKEQKEGVAPLSKTSAHLVWPGA